jgi:hypothetical protein
MVLTSRVRRLAYHADQVALYAKMVPHVRKHVSQSALAPNASIMLRIARIAYQDTRW